MELRTPLKTRDYGAECVMPGGSPNVSRLNQPFQQERERSMARYGLSHISCAIVARSLPDPILMADPRSFAWEILRRRADYIGAPAVAEHIGTADAPIELIRPTGTAADWGLRFR